MSEMMATYFAQYPVEKVSGTTDDWTIHFEGGGAIRCLSAGDKPDVKDRALVNVLYDPQNTTFVFTGDVRVQVPATEYTVTHPTHTKGEEVYPQRPVEAAAVPPDPSADRVADGPEESDGKEEA